ncbi:MAG: hypothetical protein IJ303_04720 [Clostridia bacterium]|nr:hypothetical protein [Clostridia bacterium]
MKERTPNNSPVGCYCRDDRAGQQCRNHSSALRSAARPSPSAYAIEGLEGAAGTVGEAEKFLDMGIDTLLTNKFCIISDYMKKRKGK